MRMPSITSIDLAIKSLNSRESDDEACRLQYLDRLAFHLNDPGAKAWINRVTPERLLAPHITLHVVIASRDKGPGQVVAGMYTARQPSTMPTVELCGLVVARGWQGFGLGRALIGAAVTDCLERDVSTQLKAVVRILPEAQSGIREMNKASAAAFSSAGFSPERILKFPVSPEQPHLAESAEADASILAIEFIHRLERKAA